MLCRLGLIICFLALSGCAYVRHSVPENFAGAAVVVGMPDIRYYVDKPNSFSMPRQGLINSFKDEGRAEYLVDGIKNYPVLIIGGGVSNSAYGIGLLKGWLEQGTRPVFKIITGYSSGSIIALATFSGKDYEDKLADLFTSISTKDVVKQNGVFGILFGNSVNSSARFAKMIDDIVDEKLMARIAQEHAKGRRLYVGTSDLDAQEFVVWDMGALASKEGAEAVKMFRKIILASCSFSSMLPPVFFQVQVGGRRYDEMHADGGVIGGIFHVYELMEGVQFKEFRTRLYILNCCYMSPHSKQIENNLTAIISRTIETNGSSKMSGDTYRLYAFAKEKGWEYNLAYIPKDFQPLQKEMFDKQEMRRLFKRGYDDAVVGYKWHKAPPGLLVEGE